MSLSLLVGRPSDIETGALRVSLCVFNSSQSYSRLSVVWSVLPHGHIGVSDVLKRCKYAFMLPCPVTMVVKLWVVVIVLFSLSATIGKESFVILPLVDRFQSLCHLSKLVSSSLRFTTLFGTLL
jgi:hypothetical protein